MKKLVIFCGLSFVPVLTIANDSTGFVATGGVTYLKNKDIQMYSEDLFISKKIIKVDYQFKNLTSKDITETVLFPLPVVDSFTDSDFADTASLIDSFRIIVNGKPIKPQMHVRAFMPPLNQDGLPNWDAPEIDITKDLKSCGFNDAELQTPWTFHSEEKVSTAKFLNCKNPKIISLMKGTRQDDIVSWSSQIIYSWKQTFKANEITSVQHQYTPLIGGSVAFSEDYEGKQYCMDANFKAGLKKAKSQHAPFQALGYVLKTGSNWAKPIENFKLTIERDANELVSFCWLGQVKKLSATQFQMIEKNFVPKQDLDIIFVSKR